MVKKNENQWLPIFLSFNIFIFFSLFSFLFAVYQSSTTENKNDKKKNKEPPKRVTAMLHLVRVTEN